MINEISLIHTLPHAFKGMELQHPVNASQIWLQEVTFTRPAVYMIEAESGTGKSSLCHYLYGCRGDYSGSILFDGKEITGFSIDRWCELRTRALAYLPQEMNLFPELTVWENIAIKNRLTSHKSDRWINHALERLEIASKTHTRAALLSVGQQQRVAIIRALCQPFDFLLIDEPVSHLDARNNTIAATLIQEEAEANGATVIATSVGNKINLPVTSTLLL